MRVKKSLFAIAVAEIQAYVAKSLSLAVATDECASQKSVLFGGRD